MCTKCLIWVNNVKKLKKAFCFSSFHLWHSGNLKIIFYCPQDPQIRLFHAALGTECKKWGLLQIFWPFLPLFWPSLPYRMGFTKSCTFYFFMPIWVYRISMMHIVHCKHVYHFHLNWAYWFTSSFRVMPWWLHLLKLILLSIPFLCIFVN